MKIVFTTIPMKEYIERLHYPVAGNTTIEYNGAVYFPVNAVLAKSLKNGETVKVVRIMNSIGASKENARIFKSELESINAHIGAQLSFYDVIEDFRENKETHESRFRKLLDFLEEDAEIIADITYGQKTLSHILFCVLNFAEKFFNVRITSVIYGKAEFENGSIKKDSQMLYDITPLYYLNTLIGAMEAPSGKDAIKALDRFFSL